MDYSFLKSLVNRYDTWFYFTCHIICCILVCLGTLINNDHVLNVQAASMFKGPVPPIVPFSLGSLGFMTPFCILQLLFTYII